VQYATPATWRYHPRSPAPLTVRASLADGRTLLAGKRGERWIDGGPGGTAEAAAELAPEDLVAVAATKDGGWLFLGRSGTSYEARSPLGPFVRSSAPLEPLARVHASGTLLAGVRRDGALVESETAGATWTRVGPEGVRFEDVALSEDGHGLALAVPEALYETRDHGRTWTRSASTNMGARALSTSDSGALVVATPLGARRWDPATDAFVPEKDSASEQHAGLGAQLPLGPSAAALASGRALVSGSRWLEARPGPEAGAYRLVSGAFGAKLEVAPLAIARGCAEVRLAGFGRTLYLACAREAHPKVTQPIEISRSSDGGLSWKREPYVVEGQIGELAMVAGADDGLLVAGICPPNARGPGCRPMGVHRRTVLSGDAGPEVALVPAAMPSLIGAVLGLSFSMDGKTAYAVARRSKSTPLAVFVSHDGGASFDARDVEAVSASDDWLQVESVSAAEDGTVAIVTNLRGRRTWLVVDEDGRAVAVTRPPVDAARLGAVGQRGIAFDPSSREAWESLDGGASFQPIGKLPLDPCAGEKECNAPVVCVSAGCVFGDSVTRVGFREAPRAVVLGPPAANDASGRPEPRVGTPFTCALEAGEWRRIPGALGAPFADQAALGKAAWFVLKHDPSTAAVSLVEARPGTPLKLDEVTLLAPSPKAADMAYTAATQVEGAAALRYVVPGGPGAGGAELRNVELSWHDLLAGHVGHAVLPNAGSFRPGDYEAVRGAVKLAKPALLSIASGGLFVRVHGTAGDAQPTYFASDRAAVEAVGGAVPWPLGVRDDWASEMVHVGGASVALHLRGAVAVRARPSDRGAFAFDAASVGFGNPAAFGLEQHVDVAYVGDRAGLLVTIQDVPGKEAFAAIYPFRPDGAVFDEPTRVPTQLDLAATPRPCSPADRTSTPRVVAPYQSGTRHPILVTDPIEPPRVLLTADAVLHGLPTSPCVDAYEAVLVSTEPASVPNARREQAILRLPLDTSEPSVLFRTRAGARGAWGDIELEFRTMTCRADPGADVPIEVFREKGTLAGLR
jgi:hypothetical protein